MTNKYELNDKEYKECLDRAILGIFSIGRPSKQPKSYFIVGQPGSGKTGLTSYIERAFNEKQGEGLVKIDPDMVGIYHQYYEQIIEEIPEESYEELQRFVYPAIKVIKKMAVDTRVNILSEGTFSSTDEYMEIIRNQIQNGYDIEIDIIAVHRLESLLSSMERQQEKIEYNLPPRTVAIRHHDRAYQQVYTTLRKIGEEGVNSKICIFRRGENEMNPHLVYSSTDNSAINPTTALAKQRETNLEEIIRSRKDFLARITMLRNRILENDDGEIKKLQMEQLDYLEQEFFRELAEFEKERE